MRKSLSTFALSEARKVHDIPLHLVDESRTKFDGLFKEHTLVLLDEFDKCSEEYENNPNIHGLFKMAETILPISTYAAVLYCNEILKQYPFHDGAKKMMEELG